nr:hypothetical protein [Massilia sp. JS1662]
MSKNKQILKLGSILLLAFATSVACHSSTVEGNPSGAEALNSGLVTAVAKLSNFKNFRMGTAELEALIKDSCTKTKEIKTDYSVVSVYGCNSKSGMKRVRMDWRNGDGDSHVMTLSVDFNYAEYEKIKTTMEQNLGRATKKRKDMIEWRPSSDKGLNAWGHPIIYVARDPDTHTASFELGLEQGP